MSRIALLLVACAAVALGLTVSGGVRHDYIYYLEQWQLVLGGQDPWSTNNAYGPLHNAFALLVPIHPLAPKIVTAAALLLASGLLVLTLERDRAVPEWRTVYLLAFGINAAWMLAVAYTLASIPRQVWFGHSVATSRALITPTASTETASTPSDHGPRSSRTEPSAMGTTHTEATR